MLCLIAGAEICDALARLEEREQEAKTATLRRVWELYDTHIGLSEIIAITHAANDNLAYVLW